jgi:hypothetical protein
VVVEKLDNFEPGIVNREDFDKALNEIERLKRDLNILLEYDANENSQTIKNLKIIIPGTESGKAIFQNT